MKKLLLLGLVLLLLTGCGASEDAEVETTAPESTSLYVPESAVETETGGVVRAYQPDKAYSTISFMGQKLLLGTSSGELSMLAGSAGELTGTYDMGIAQGKAALQTTLLGITYYQKAENAVITCNSMLQQTGTYPLPESISGVPVTDLSNQTIYYCAGNELKALDISLGVTRLLKQYQDAEPSLSGSLFDNSVLICKIGDEINYISAANGQTLSRDSGITDIQSSGSRYLLHRTDGSVPQIIFGALDSAPQSLNIIQDGVTVKGVPALNGAVAWQMGDTGLTLSYYDLSTGKRTAGTTITGISEPIAIASEGKAVWLLTKEYLLRWDILQSPTEEETVYTGKVFTASSPDTAGIAQCQKKADSLSKTYGIRFRLNQDALKVTGGYSFQPEYQVSAINTFLDAITPILSQFPTNFWSKTLRNGRVYISLVREIAGEEDYVLYHQDSSAYIVFAYNADIAQCLYHATGYLVDSFVLGNSRDYDDWDQLNPEGFVYGETVSPGYLTESNRYFIDEQATKSPRDDRQKIFAYAMQADKANYFSTPAMQAKLRLVCGGIRESYGLEKQKVAYPWEQHLNEPMYKK